MNNFHNLKNSAAVTLILVLLSVSAIRAQTGNLKTTDHKEELAQRPADTEKGPSSVDVRRFEDEKLRREQQKSLTLDGLASSYAARLKAALEKAWLAPQHNGLLVTKRKIVLNGAGKITERQAVKNSGSTKEDQSVDDLLDSFGFIRLPQELEKVELNVSFMSDGNMNMVDVTTPRMFDAASFAVRRRTGESGADFGPYMADLQRRTKRAWFPPKGEEQKRVVVVFNLGANGELIELRLDHSSGSAAADEAALNAVRHAAPFRPLPEGAKAPVGIQFTFDYNVFSGGGRGVFRQF